VVNIVEPSLGLAFTETAVIAHAEPVKVALLERVRRAGQRGCAAYCGMVDAVWRNLHPVIAAQRTGRQVDLQLVVVRDPDINALSFPDGTVVLSESFIHKQVLGPAELAFVLAHEAAHVLMQHERQGLTSMLALIPSRARRTPQDVYTAMAFNYVAMADAMQVVFHQLEREADELGLQLAALAGYPPHAQLRFLEHASTHDLPRPSMVSSHPEMTSRLERLRRLLPKAQRLWELGLQ
jgi:predicted Zn-dependent protease